MHTPSSNKAGPNVLHAKGAKGAWAECRKIGKRWRWTLHDAENQITHCRWTHGIPTHAAIRGWIDANA